MRRRLPVLGVSLVLCLALVGCGRATQPGLVGTWTANIRATVAGKSELVPAMTVFRDDGTFTLTEHLPGSDSGNPRHGTWTRQPNGTFDVRVDGEGMGQTARLQGGKLYSSGGTVWSRQ